MTPEVFTLGNLTVDDIVFWNGNIWMGQTGGNALYSAVGARIWLETVGMIARVGRNYPQKNLQALQELGIQPICKVVPEANMGLWVLYEANGERQYIRHPGAGNHENLSLLAEDIPTSCLAEKGYHIAPMPSSRQVSLVKGLKRPTNIISLDPPDNWTDKKYSMEDILSGVDIFLPSELEAKIYYGKNDPESAAPAFAQMGPRIVAIKLGKDGCIVFDQTVGNTAHVPAYPAKVVDTTGAGDAFCGGFLAGYIRTGDALQAACYGTISSSFVIEQVGALSVTVDQMTEAIQRLNFFRDLPIINSAT